MLQDGHPPHVFSATFESLDAEKVVRCFEGTRVDILDQVYRWIDDGQSDVTRIFWINGSAGTGKTVILFFILYCIPTFDVICIDDRLHRRGGLQ